MSIINYILIVGGFVAFVTSIAFLVIWYRAAGKVEAMNDARTCTVQQLTAMLQQHSPQGDVADLPYLCEVKGTVECETPLTAPISCYPCVAYKRDVSHDYEEQFQEEEYEQGAVGKTRRIVTSKDHGNEWLRTDQEQVHFWINDGTGRILVDPEGAELDLARTGYHREDGLAGASALWSTEGKRSLCYYHTEYALALGWQGYVLGCAVNRNGQCMIVRHPSNRSKFLISWQTREQLTGEMKRTANTNLIIAIILIILGPILMGIGLIL